MSQSDFEMPFWDHLEELRWRLIKSLVTIILGALITYYFGDIVIYLLIKPAKSLNMELNLQVLKVTSMFNIKLAIALFGGMVIGLPIIIIQFWKFISPALDKKYSGSIFLTIFCSILFFLIGMAFAYFVIIPYSLEFFTSISSDVIAVNYNFTLDSYLIYMLWLVFGCGLLFQLPVISIFFSRIGVFNPEFLRQYRKYAIIISLLFSAVLTPPDPLSQILIFFPLLLLYEISIVLSKLFQKNNSII